MSSPVRPTAWLGGGALVGAVLVFGLSIGLAMGGGGDSGDPIPVPDWVPAAGGEPVAEPGVGGPAGGVAPSRTPAPAELRSDVLRLAVQRAPFEEDREAPSARYRMPGEDEPEEDEEEEDEPEVPEFRLLGSVAIGLEGWAILQVGDDDPALLQSGQSLEGYRLAAVQPDMVVMASADGMVQVPLAQPARTPPRATAGRGGDGQQGGRGGRGNAQNARGGGAAGRGNAAAAAGRGGAAAAGRGAAAAGALGLGQIIQGLPAEAQVLIRQIQGQGGGQQITIQRGGGG